MKDWDMAETLLTKTRYDFDDVKQALSKIEGLEGNDLYRRAQGLADQLHAFALEVQRARVEAQELK